jgi:hypothetical protein
MNRMAKLGVALAGLLMAVSVLIGCGPDDTLNAPEDYAEFLSHHSAG